jgi:hypothetical protein
MGRDVCGICWCPYDEEGKCGCENVKVINPAPTKVMKGTCIRCGKPFRSVDDIHTCTPPRALVLAEELESFPLAAADHAADELRRQYEEIENLKRDLHHYMLAANAEAQLVDELQRENEALLKQALYVIEAWERGCDKESYERDIDDAITAIKERLNG